MPQTRRERLRVETIEEIKSTAWKQIGEHGPGSLSLRAIARQMGMTAPGLYRYYEHRDALVTALMMDAFASFTASLEAALDVHTPDDHAGRFRSICRAYFQWAAENPQRYMLLFDTPIQGYLFAQELGPVAQRSFLVLLGVIGEAHATGKLSSTASATKLPASLNVQYEALSQLGMPYSGPIIQSALSVWSTIHGITSLFLHHYLAGFLQAGLPAFVDFEIEKMSRALGLE